MSKAFRECLKQALSHLNYIIRMGQFEFNQKTQYEIFENIYLFLIASIILASSSAAKSGFSLITFLDASRP